MLVHFSAWTDHFNPWNLRLSSPITKKSVHSFGSEFLDLPSEEANKYIIFAEFFLVFEILDDPTFEK